MINNFQSLLVDYPSPSSQPSAATTDPFATTTNPSGPNSDPTADPSASTSHPFAPSSDPSLVEADAGTRTPRMRPGSFVEYEGGDGVGVGGVGVGVGGVGVGGVVVGDGYGGGRGRLSSIDSRYHDNHIVNTDTSTTALRPSHLDISPHCSTATSTATSHKNPATTTTFDYSPYRSPKTLAPVDHYSTSSGASTTRTPAPAPSTSTYTPATMPTTTPVSRSTPTDDPTFDSTHGFTSDSRSLEHTCYSNNVSSTSTTSAPYSNPTPTSYSTAPSSSSTTAATSFRRTTSTTSRFL